MSFRIVNNSLNGQVGGWPAQIPNIWLVIRVWSSQVLSASFIPQYFYLKHLKGIPVNPTFASYEANKYHTAKSGVILTWALFDKAPGRYHITIELPSPRIMAGLSSSSGKPSCSVILIGCLTRNAASRSTATPDSLCPRSLASLLNSIPEGTENIVLNPDC